MGTNYQLVFMTAASSDEAYRIAETLVAEGLAACVNAIPSCRSIYKWQEEIVKDDEVMMIAKTKETDFDAVAKRVTELHSYDVPEIIAVRLDAIADGYHGFLRGVLG